MKRGELNDPYIIGHIFQNKVVCDICEQSCNGIVVKNVLLPERIEPSTKLLVCLPNTPNQPELFKWPDAIGIGCGCYAKVHRQIAHILSRQQMRKHT